MWDAECEAKARALMWGYVHDNGKPPLEEQERAANWLNQMLPYPGWRFNKYGSNAPYWVLAKEQGWHVYLAPVVGYVHSTSEESTDTLMEMITQLEMKI